MFHFKNKNHKIVLTLVLPLLAIIFFASYSALSKKAVEEIHPLLVLLYVQMMSVMLFSMMMGAVPEIKKIFKETINKRVFFVSISLLSSVLAPLSLFFGLQYTTALNCALLSNMYSVFFFLFSIIWFKEKLVLSRGLGMLILLGGVLIIVFEGKWQSIDFKWGDLLIILAAFFWCLGDILYKQYFEKLHPDAAVLGRNTISLMIIMLVMFVFYADLPWDIHWETVPYLIALALFPVLLGQFFWYKSIRYSSAMTLALLTLATPFFAVLFAFLLLGEKLYFYHLAGGVLIVAGLLVSQMKRHMFLNHGLHRVKQMTK